jgi:hypothetical protein
MNVKKLISTLAAVAGLIALAPAAVAQDKGCNTTSTSSRP